MIVVECAQGSPEWHAARIGVVTGSEFVTARGRYKTGKEVGRPNAAAKNYAFKKAIERIGGKLLDDGFENWGMKRGHELEPAARLEHELQLGEVVHRCGFVQTDDRLYGCSLDGMIGNRLGGSEYKCFASPEKMRDILLEGDLSEVIDQVQGGIWIAELEWMDFCLYCPELASAGNTLWHQRVYRDDAYIAALREDLSQFNELVEDYIGKLRARLGGQVPIPQPVTQDRQLIAARIGSARNQAEADLILDSLGVCTAEFYAELHVLVDQRFSRV